MWETNQIRFQLGEDIDLDEVLNQLVQMGYQRTGMVSTPGEFSLRGGIVDVFPLTSQNPVRIELFDTEIDSIRLFSVEDQRSIDKLNEVEIGPATEVLLKYENIERLIQRIEAGLSASLKKIKAAAVKEKMTEYIGHEMGQLKNGQVPEQIFKYLSLAYESPSSLLDYLPHDGVYSLMISVVSRK